MASSPSLLPASSADSQGTSGELVRLSLTKVDAHADTVKSAKPFHAMLNPQKVQHAQSITYDSRQPPGSTGSRNAFAKMPPGTASCELLFDGTGAVPAKVGQSMDIDKQIDELREVVYEFVGNKHEPGHVKLIWGSLILFVRLTTLTVNYTLFKPSGAPLRATVALSFTEFLNYQEAQAKAGRSSPDLTHSVLVREGDTLPLLCKRIYGDPAYYLAVARHNKLNDIRKLHPGARLSFPRLV